MVPGGGRTPYTACPDAHRSGDRRRTGGGGARASPGRCRGPVNGLVGCGSAVWPCLPDDSQGRVLKRRLPADPRPRSPQHTAPADRNCPCAPAAGASRRRTHPGCPPAPAVAAGRDWGRVERRAPAKRTRQSAEGRLAGMRRLAWPDRLPAGQPPASGCLTMAGVRPGRRASLLPTNRLSALPGGHPIG